MWRNVILVGMLVCLVLPAAAGEGAAVPGAPIDLLTGLREGRLFAQFRGAGGSSVTGVLGGVGAGPLQVQIPSGTQFMAQLPGRQGMSTLGSLNLNIGEGQLAHVSIATACTALGLPEPTPEDVMIPMPCPDARLARVAAVLDLQPVAHPVAQVAVWAISDNPPANAVQPYLMTQAPGFNLAAYAQRRGIMQQAAGLLQVAGLQPAAFRMFMGLRLR